MTELTIVIGHLITIRTCSLTLQDFPCNILDPSDPDVNATDDITLCGFVCVTVQRVTRTLINYLWSFVRLLVSGV